jgi:hypothetical protein
MSSETVCQVAHSWVDVSSFHTHFFGVVYVTCGDFHDGSEKVTVSVLRILCQSWEKCYRDPHNDSTCLRGQKLESCTGVSMACPVVQFKTGRTSVDNDEHTGRPRSCTTPETVARIQELFCQDQHRIGPFTTLLRWELVMEHANGF